MSIILKPPFPYFGGKRQVADTIWQGLGEVSNYVEPFAGSLAVLLANHKIPKIETVNDKNCFLSNFWRAVSMDPAAVAQHADYPVHEDTLHARHQWLVSSATDEFRTKMNNDPDYYDAKIAGYWVWGISASIGNNWLNTKGLRAAPMLSSAGGGIQGLTYDIQDQFKKLQERLRRVRVCCGDWKKVLTPSITHANKGLTAKDITAVFLDPPYSGERDKVYQEEDDNIFKEVVEWALANGDNPRIRIALCGYEGDHGIAATWQEHSWKANGGMGNLGDDRGKANANKERVWFSPHCLKV